MFQGKGLETDATNRELGFDPAEIDHVILSHAHIDHSGLIPYIYRLGFHGSVVCTSATRDLCAIMLTDSGHIQEMDYTLNNFFNEGLLPKVNIYIDSPLAVNATDIFRLHLDNLNDAVHKVMENDPDPFGFSSLRYIKKVTESKKLNTLRTPCVIISASGMAEAGRIKHHLANNIENPDNTVLFVGYCAPATLGARILDGEDPVSIFGVKHPVKAAVERIEAFSGHGDYREMKQYLHCQEPKQVKQVFLVHGEFDAQAFYRGEPEMAGFKNVSIPDKGTEVVI